MQVAAPKELSSFIKHYLFLENKGCDVKHLRLFSDGTSGMVLCLQNTLITELKENNNTGILPSSFVYGHISGFKDLHTTGNTALLVVVFQPWGINKLTGIPAWKLMDKIISTEDIFGMPAKKLEQDLYRQERIENKLGLLNTFFSNRISEKVLPNHTLIDASLKLIYANKGIVSSDQLEKYTGYTERYIERKFTDAIGNTPKRFCNIVKLHHFLGRLKINTAHEKLTAIAYEAGYADQSHLVKEFKKHTGITPGQYLHKSHKLSVNFIELGMVNTG